MTTLAVQTQTQKWIELWLSECKSPHTRSSYDRTIRRLLDVVGDKELTDITRHDLLMFRVSLEKSQDARSRNQSMCAVKSLFGYVSECAPDWLRRNVAASLKLENFESARITVPSETQVAKMLRCDLPPEDSLMLKLLYYTACRASEVSKIRWSDFEVTEKGITVRIQGKGRKIYYSDIPPKLYATLQEKFAGRDPLFGDYDRSAVYRVVKRAAEYAGIPDVSPHSLRHACATHLARLGIQPLVIAEHLGHRSLKTTMQYFDLAKENVSSVLEAAIEE